MTMVGPGSNGSLGGVDVGPYEATINGVATPVICDDFYDETYLNESWTATASTFADLSQTKFGNDPLATQKYEEVAWLSLQLMNPVGVCPPGTANCAGDIQFAIWQVFDNSGWNQPFSYLNPQDQTVASGLLSEAAINDKSVNLSDFTIYTPNRKFWPPQEFIVVSTPEPPELTTLAVDLSAVGALVLLFRRRRARRS